MAVHGVWRGRSGAVLRVRCVVQVVCRPSQAKRRHNAKLSASAKLCRMINMWLELASPQMHKVPAVSHEVEGSRKEKSDNDAGLIDQYFAQSAAGKLVVANWLCLSDYVCVQ